MGVDGPRKSRITCLLGRLERRTWRHSMQILIRHKKGPYKGHSKVAHFGENGEKLLIGTIVTWVERWRKSRIECLLGRLEERTLRLSTQNLISDKKGP